MKISMNALKKMIKEAVSETNRIQPMTVKAYPASELMEQIAEFTGKSLDEVESTVSSQADFKIGSDGMRGSSSFTFIPMELFLEYFEDWDSFESIFSYIAIDDYVYFDA
jgi:hypothetical protein